MSGETVFDLVLGAWGVALLVLLVDHIRDEPVCDDSELAECVDACLAEAGYGG